MGSDKRTIKRRQLLYYLPVLDADTNEMLGRIVDITTEGLMLTNEEAMNEESVRDIIIVPESEMVDIDKIHLTAECRWSRKANMLSGYDNGLFFLNMTKDKIKTITELIKYLQFNQ